MARALSRRGVSNFHRGDGNGFLGKLKRAYGVEDEQFCWRGYQTNVVNLDKSQALCCHQVFLLHSLLAQRLKSLHDRASMLNRSPNSQDYILSARLLLLSLPLRSPFLDPAPKLAPYPLLLSWR